MDIEPEVKEPEVICQQMEETRASLADKLETLEQQVVETVRGATCAVTETVETVKEAVQETVSTVQDSVSNAFDLNHHVESHPWAMFAGSVAVGFIAGKMLPSSNGSSTFYSNDGQPITMTRKAQRFMPESEGDGERKPYSPRSREEKSWFGLGDTFQSEINKLKGLAVGTMLGLVRDFVSQSAPEQLRPRLQEVMDSITTKLGGETLEGPLVDTATAFQSERRSRYEECNTPEMGRSMDPAYR